MALKSTIFKANLQVADIDHGHYADHAVTLARHPSEADERMMVRLLALALNAHAIDDLCQGDGRLGFGAGLSDPDDPDVLLCDFTGRKRLWIEVGLPDEKPLVKASGKADAVLVYAYGHSAEVWWKGLMAKLRRLDRLHVWRIPTQASAELALMAERSMQCQVTIQEGEVTFSSDKGMVSCSPELWQ